MGLKILLFKISNCILYGYWLSKCLAVVTYFKFWHEYTYGSWAAMPVKFSKSDWNEVRKNEERLYFAGEHTSSNYGFVHSAYQSGEQTAKEIYNEINNILKPPTTERKYCPGNIH